MIPLHRRDALIAAAVLLLAAVAIVRVAVPDRSRLRPLSIEGFEVERARVGPGETVTREVEWRPKTDVYVLGWNPWLDVPADARFDADLVLYDPEAHTAVFVMGQRVMPPTGVDPWREMYLPPGTGYRVSVDHAVKLRYRVTNPGATTFETRATALVYFVPVQDN